MFLIDIRKVAEEPILLDNQQDVLLAKLSELQQQKQEYEEKQIMTAFRKSGKSKQKLMTFLNV